MHDALLDINRWGGRNCNDRRDWCISIIGSIPRRRITVRRWIRRSARIRAQTVTQQA